MRQFVDPAVECSPIPGEMSRLIAAKDWSLLVRDKDSAVLEVADTGLGIDPETIRRLFEPFAQADRSLDRSRGGLGLGLALVKGMVELHGGQVSAHSDGPGTGSRFTVKFPLDEREVVVPL
jgi:signal transduction histidine kinase